MVSGIVDDHAGDVACLVVMPRPVYTGAGNGGDTAEVQSLTKRRMTPDEIAALVQHGLGPDAEVLASSEFTDSYFSTVHAVTLTDGSELVLKIAPEPGPALLRYEVDLIHTEIEFYRRAGAAGVPLPELVVAEPDHGYLLTRRLRGQPLGSVAETMTRGQLEAVRREIGEICTRLRRVIGTQFGYPRRDGRTRSASWRASFLTMVDDILADAVDHGCELPEHPVRIRELVERHSVLLDEVATPVLVHFDLWDGNVFVVDDGDGSYRVEGIIDGERAFYGDAIAELTSLAFFADPATVPGVLDGFLGRQLSDSETVRLSLYRVYLYLIMVTEGVPRGFDPVEHGPVRRYVLAQLDDELAYLSRR
ncbi:aminoglycoside phosphotransferase family protein [Actinobacteria bacterium YIM 96077]|uniref:Aminoglycoside phosphotransferase family protein n=1 Tax=Phytoactinopolyspora halophila TaxID=1981511 RepID=A0A329QAH8_9ACTN|nr:aminoglycoside phosphotransferase family protein [Phytoactinopolyspora halophila]AYY12470.1 aminoglycoside phosphotransferase family protein [Actinobacteria bacterium YIM 96077]RAW09333.1 aminoglycoside phosphotransferase family protein [Phytoactinopolyspora halophila]